MLCVVAQRFVAALRSQKTLFSSPGAGAILRFIAPCSGVILGGSASAFLQEGPKGHLHPGCSGFASVLTEISNKKGPNLWKKLGPEGRTCTSPCPHSVSPFLYASSIPAGSGGALRGPKCPGLSPGHEVALSRGHFPGDTLGLSWQRLWRSHQGLLPAPVG